MQTFQGVIKHFTFEADDSFFKVAVLRTQDGSRLTCRGSMPCAYLGANVLVQGEMGTHPKYGQQLTVSKFEVVRPKRKNGIIAYLSSGLIKGIGKTYAQKIVDEFGPDTFDILDNHPERLTEINGIGAKKCASITKSWKENKTLAESIIFLSSIQAPSSAIMRIVERYKEQTETIIRENPYRLIDDFDGIGFIVADRIAMALGHPQDSYVRLTAAVRYIMMEQSYGEGNVFLSLKTLYQHFYQLVHFDRDTYIRVMREAVMNGDIIHEADRFYLPYLYQAETNVAKLLYSRSMHIVTPVKLDIEAIEEITGVHYDETQKEAISLAMRSSIMVMTGGPGTGKTVTIGGIISAFSFADKRISLAAPTGRAAKRMSEATGYDACTIHRLLEYNGGYFQRNAQNKLECDILILDECSMIDLSLMEKVLDALPEDAVLIMTGDVDQLPSVGPGCVLKDTIDCDFVPVVRLTFIHRQGKDSLIAENAHLVNNGFMIRNAANYKTDDFLYHSVKEEDSMLSLVVQYAKKHMRTEWGIQEEDVQILAPMKKGPLGTENLNLVLQEALNPPDEEKCELRVNEWRFREGDRVMQIRNNYEKEVFNGDVGKISKILPKERQLMVSYPDKENDVVYDSSDYSELILAYAVTVHKSQGSEYGGVIMVLAPSHWRMLKRKLLYTAITRAKKEFVLLGTNDALCRAIVNDEEDQRNSFLKERIAMEAAMREEERKNA